MILELLILHSTHKMIEKKILESTMYGVTDYFAHFDYYSPSRAQLVTVLLLEVSIMLHKCVHRIKHGDLCIVYVP